MGRLGEPSRAVHYPEKVVISPQDESLNPDDSTATILSAELSTINSQLISHGWAKKPLNLGALGQKDYNDLVAVLFELLGAGVSNLNTLDTFAGRHRTLEYEHERLQKTTNNLRSTNAKLETEVAGWKARCAEVEKRLQLEEIKTKELREEAVRGRKALETVRVAAGHETKKIQMKLDKTLGQLAKVSNDPSVTARSQGLVLLNPIPAGRIQPVAATQSPLLEQTLRELSDIRESLQEETEAFRHVVVSAGNGLREALAAAYGQETPPRLLHSQFFTNPPTSNPRSLNMSSTHTLQSASSTSHPSIAHSRIQQLIAQIRARITEGVPKFSANVDGRGNERSPEEIEEQKRVEREQDKKQRDMEDRVKDLEVELVCARKREEEASRLVEEYAAAQLQQGMRSEEHGEAMEKQKQALDDERRRYAEEAVKLGQERQRLEAERQAFLEEQRRVEMDAMLAMLPVTPAESGLPAPPTNAAEPEEIPYAPSSSTWNDHRPHSPSPLSPQRPKHHTPRPHMAGRRKSMKTPLSRLVLEKAVRQKGRELGVSAGLTKEPLGGNVLGAERGRRTNIGASVSSPSRKGKEKAAGQGQGSESSTARSSTLGKSRASGVSLSSASYTSSTIGVTPASRPALGAGVAATGSTMRSSTMRASALGVSQRKVDMNKVGGVGPKAAAKGKGVWR